MAFNINAQVILSGPKNLKAITKKIESGLAGVSTPIQLKMDKGLTKQITTFSRGISTLNKSLQNLQTVSKVADTSVKSTSKSLKEVSNVGKKVAQTQNRVADSFKKTGKDIQSARSELQLFGKDAALALRRFAGFTIATTVVFGFTRAVGNATKAALEFQREMVKVVQITGQSGAKLEGLRNTINQLSVSLGIDANELAGLARTFAQTGQTIDQVRASIKAIARSSLTPTFGSMKDTTEGLIAAMAQFGIQAGKAEEVLASMNAISKKFAVEAEDLVSVIRRAGGVFSTAAGRFKEPQEALNELMGIFTAVRSTTRESAETIAVGLRTIFTRIQRGSTIKFLEQFNIQLINAKGNFIGLFPAFQELSRGLDDIMRSGDALTLSKITEELGGVRQVGKLIPAIKEFNKALEATEIAGNAAKKGLGKDVALALQPVAKQFEVMKQRFNAFVRDVASSRTFQQLAKTAISIGNAFLKIAETLKPLIPLIATIATVKLTKGAFQFGAGFFGGLKKGGGAEGIGGNIANVVTGGGRGGGIKAGVGGKGMAGAAIQANTQILKQANISIQTLSTRIGDSIVALQQATTQSEARQTTLLGAVGNLINALNRSGGGLGGFPAPKKFARGGVVSGPSHGGGGVLAELEGGETVIPKGYATGGKVELKKGSVGGFFLRPDKGGETSWGFNREISLAENPLLEKIALQNMSKTAAETKGTSIERTGPQLDDLKGREATWSLQGGAAENINQGSLDKFGGLSVQEQRDASKSIRGRDRSGEIDPNFRGSGQLSASHSLRKLQTAIDKGTGSGAVARQRKSLDFLQISGTNQGFFTSRKDMGGEGTAIHDLVQDQTALGVRNAVDSVADSVRGNPVMAKLKLSKGPLSDAALKKIDTKTVEGYVLEGLVEALTGAGIAGKKKDASGKLVEAGFDFPNVTGARGILGEFFGAEGLVNELRKADAKRKAHSGAKGSISDKIVGLFKGDPKEAWKSGIIQGEIKPVNRAAGGNIFSRRGTDTVPAMLTPGEFVINKKSAQGIGYSNLKGMNRYARGGVVGGNIQYLAKGGESEKVQDLRGLGVEAGLSDAMDRLIDTMIDRVNNAGAEIQAMKQERRDPLGAGRGLGKQQVDLNKPLLDIVSEQGGRVKELNKEIAFQEDAYAKAKEEQNKQLSIIVKKSEEIVAADKRNAALEQQRLEASFSLVNQEKLAGRSEGLQNRMGTGGQSKPPEPPKPGEQISLFDKSKPPEPPDTVMKKLQDRFTSLGKEAEGLVKQLASGELTMDEYASEMERLQSSQDKVAKSLNKAPVGGSPQARLVGKTVGGVGGGKAAEVAAQMAQVRGGGIDKSAGDAATAKAQEAESEKRQQLVSGIGSSVAAVAGFTAAIKGFDLKNPIASIVSLGYASQQASAAIKAFGMAGLFKSGGSLDKLKKSFMGFKLPTRGGSRGAVAGAGGGFASSISDQVKGIKAAPKKIFGSLTSGTKEFSALRAKGVGPMKAFTQSISKSKGALLKTFNAGSMKKLLAGGFKGLPGIITALVGTMIVGPMAKKISQMSFGEKEKIEGTNIEGFRGGSSAAGATAGALGAAGGATGAAIGFAAVGAAPLGLFVAALLLAKGALKGWAKQLEFNAFADLQKSVRKSIKAFEEFAELPSVTATSLGNLNNTTEAVSKRFDASFKASKFREDVDQAFTTTGLLGKGGTLQSAMGLGSKMTQAGEGGPSGSEFADMTTAVVGVGASMAAGAAIGATIGGIVGSIIPWIGTGLVAAVGAGIGALVGLGVSMFSTDKSLASTAKAFDKAAAAISPEFLENLDKAWEHTIGSMVNQLQLLDPNLIGEMAVMDTANITLDQSAMTTADRATKALEQWDAALNQAEDSLGGATSKTAGFVAELRRMQAMKAEFALMDAVKKEAEFLGEAAAENLKAGFQQVRTLKQGKDEGGAAFLARQKELINNMSQLGALEANTLKAALDGEALKTVAQAKTMATEKAVAAAFAEANREIDALAAGMTKFAAATSGITSQLKTFIGNLTSEFDQLFSDNQIIKEVSETNPFTNVEGSTRQQIQAGVEQISGMGQFPAGKDPFKDMSGLISGQKEIPIALKEALDELVVESTGDKAVQNVDIFDRVVEKLGKKGITLPPQALAGMEGVIKGVAGRQEGDLFKAEGLKSLLEGEDAGGGEIGKLLIPMSQEAQKAMEVAFQASQDYRNSLLKIAALQQKMIEKQRNLELSAASKEQSVRDRVNKALGKTPNIWKKAVGDMRKKMTTLTANIGGIGVGGTGVGGVAPADVFSANVLVGQRQALEKEKTKQEDILGLGGGQMFDATAIDTLSKSQREAAKTLAAVNAQLNGNTAALKELANDTKLLAAIEAEMVTLQKESMAAEQSAMKLAEAVIAVKAQTMSPADFKKNFTDKQAGFETFRSGGDLGADEAVSLRKSIMGGGDFLAGDIGAMFENIAAQRTAAGKKTATGEDFTAADIKKEKLKELTLAISTEAAALAGGGIGQSIQRNTLRAASKKAQAEQKGGEMKTLAQIQIDAQQKLFQEQEKGAKAVFDKATAGLDTVIVHFQEAVDDFRELRGMNLTGAEGAAKVNKTTQAVAKLEKAVAAEKDPGKKKKLQRDLDAARIDQGEAQSNFNRAKERGEKSVSQAIKAREAAQQKVDRLGAGAASVEEYAFRAKGKVAKGIVGESIRDPGRAGVAGMAGKLENMWDTEGGWSENYFTDLLKMGGAGDQELAEMETMQKEGLGMGFFGNQEFQEGRMKGTVADQDKLFKTMSERMFGVGTESAKEFQQSLREASAETQKASGDANDFFRKVEPRFKAQVQRTRDQQAAAGKGASKNFKEDNKNRTMAKKSLATKEAVEKKVIATQKRDVALTKKVQAEKLTAAPQLASSDMTGIIRSLAPAGGGSRSAAEVNIERMADKQAKAALAEDFDATKVVKQLDLPEISKEMQAEAKRLDPSGGEFEKGAKAAIREKARDEGQPMMGAREGEGARKAIALEKSKEKTLSKADQASEDMFNNIVDTAKHFAQNDPIGEDKPMGLFGGGEVHQGAIDAMKAARKKREGLASITATGVGAPGAPAGAAEQARIKARFEEARKRTDPMKGPLKIPKEASIGTAAGMDVTQDPLGMQKKMREAFMSGPGGFIGGREEGGLPNLPGRPEEKDPAKNVFEALKRGGENAASVLKETFTTAAESFKEVITSSDVGEALGGAVKKAFDATKIDLNANLGAITVNLAGGELLKTLSKQLLDKLRGDIAEVVSSLFNNDGSMKTMPNAKVPKQE